MLCSHTSRCLLRADHDLFHILQNCKRKNAKSTTATSTTASESTGKYTYAFNSTFKSKKLVKKV